MVGVALIALPADILAWFGFSIDSTRFFSTQGGVFHIVMSVAYMLAARQPLNERSLLIFIISAKIIAFFFLGLFFFLGEMVPVIALSAVSDGLMGLVVWLFFKEQSYQEMHSHA